ncbi:MAG: hypothetical protein QMB67_05850 [Sulfurospirillum sp.]
MIVKKRQCRFSSTKYNINEKNKLKKAFKKKSKRKVKKRIIENKIIKQFDYNSKIEFPKDISHLNSCLKYMEKFNDDENCRIWINHKKLKDIDNSSILFLTANIDQIRHGEKLRKDKRLAPSKNINKRLMAIGYWQALCSNSVHETTNLKYLKIRSANKVKKTDNDFHTEIVEFFTQEKYGISSPEHKDALFDALYEAMANAVEHAYIDCADEEKKIWLMGAHNEEKNQLEFVFYDIGIGIFASLEHGKKAIHKAMRKFYRIFGRNETLKTLCTSDLSRFKKEKLGRGQGMIAFKTFIDIVSGTQIAQLEVITENLMYNSKNNEVTKIKQPIKGTLVRWTIGGVEDENSRV